LRRYAGFCAALTAALIAFACAQTAPSSPIADASTDDVADSAVLPDADWSIIACRPDFAKQTCPYDAVREFGCPATIDDVPLSTWCGLAPGLVYQAPSPCQGLLLIAVTSGIDSRLIYFFDESTHRLTNIFSGVVGDQYCIYGTGSIPRECAASERGWAPLCAPSPRDAGDDASDADATADAALDDGG
jgi:hypothetical protein